MWTEEAGPLAAQTIRDVTGSIRPGRARCARVTTRSSTLGSRGFMLSSTMTAERRQQLGYYPVGGCGGNIAWHTEDDTLEIADRDNLLRDIRLYATAVLRAANAPVPPFDFRLTLENMTATLGAYQEMVGDRFDF